MRNSILQFLWYRILKGIVPRIHGLRESGSASFLADRIRRGNGIDIRYYSRRMLIQVITARCFGSIKFVMFGDSNGEVFAEERDMKQFPGVAVNLSIGGTRADDWAEFWKTEEGKGILWWLRFGSNPTVIINVGGNNVLQRKLKLAYGALAYLKQVFPRAYATTAPPIHVSFIRGLTRVNVDTIRDEVLELNRYITETFKPRVIDLYSPFLNPETGEAWPMILSDPVHFSQAAQTIILRAFRSVRSHSRIVTWLADRLR